MKKTLWLERDSANTDISKVSETVLGINTKVCLIFINNYHTLKAMVKNNSK